MTDAEKKIYHGIITKCWGVFSKERPYPEFSDEWWRKLIADFISVRAEYQGTPYEEFVNELCMRFQDQHERRQKEWKRTTV